MKKVSGFTLIEVIVSGALVATTVGALFAVGTMTTRITTLGQDRLIASELAREGIEVVRQVRDNNFVGDSNTPSCTTSLCGDWRQGILLNQPEVRQIESSSKAFLYRQIVLDPKSATGFSLDNVNLTAQNPCSDYLDRTDPQFTIEHGPTSNQNVFQKFCRRIVVEAVGDLNVPGSSTRESSQTLRIRSQVAWLGNGRTSFRTDFSDPRCDAKAGETEWCTEQVTLLTSWRPAL